MVTYTAKYTKISSGYMGQLVEWPEVVTENGFYLLREGANYFINGVIRCSSLIPFV